MLYPLSYEGGDVGKQPSHAATRRGNRLPTANGRTRRDPAVLGMNSGVLSRRTLRSAKARRTEGTEVGRRREGSDPIRSRCDANGLGAGEMAAVLTSWGRSCSFRRDVDRPEAVI